MTTTYHKINGFVRTNPDPLEPLPLSIVEEYTHLATHGVSEKEREAFTYYLAKAGWFRPLPHDPQPTDTETPMPEITETLPNGATISTTYKTGAICNGQYMRHRWASDDTCERCGIAYDEAKRAAKSKSTSQASAAATVSDATPAPAALPGQPDSLSAVGAAGSSTPAPAAVLPISSSTATEPSTSAATGLPLPVVAEVPALEQIDRGVEASDEIKAKVVLRHLLRDVQQAISTALRLLGE